MSALILPPIQLTGTAALATIGAVPAGKVWRVDLRACNIAAADAYADVYINDTGTPANSGYRCKNYPVPYLQAGSAPDLEYGLILTAGQQLQIRASAINAIAFSLSPVQTDAS
jgi:hypothetical protein